MLKTYQCHKRVKAGKIKEIRRIPDGMARICFEELSGRMSHKVPHIDVPASFVEKPGVMVGGYYVEYEDGYQSYSPAKAFEEGYSLIFEGVDIDAARMPRYYKQGRKNWNDILLDRPFEHYFRRHVSPPQNASALSFGAAIEALKAGKRVARAGWNGKGMWLLLNKGAIANPGPDIKTGESPLRVAPTVVDGISSDLFHWAHIGITTVLPSISMKTATGSILNGWLASQTDMLAEDWEILP